MNSITLLLFSVAWLMCIPGYGGDLSAPAATETKAAPARQPVRVRVEMLMVSMPQYIALGFLPDLRDEAKIDAAVARIMTSITRKEAFLMGLPMVVGRSGHKAVAETIDERRSPTEWYPYSAMSGMPPTKVQLTCGLPIMFETRNTGAALEVEPVIDIDGERVALNGSAQYVSFLGFDKYYWSPPAELRTKLDQPVFAILRTSISTTLRSGQRRLLAVHKLSEPAGHLAFFIMQTAIE